MFQNPLIAREKAKEITAKRDYKTAAARKSAQTQITNRKERELDDWTRKNVGLD